MGNSLQIGQDAPNFSLQRDGGKTVSLADFHGKPLVIFFYPRDNTPGCTTEAKAFSALKDAFDQIGVAVIGMSADSVKKHENFIKKQNLTVPLVADPDHNTLEAYGVWQKKSMYGREYMGIVRTTVLIDKEGKIAQIWQKVKVDGHAEAVLEVAKQLQS